MRIPNSQWVEAVTGASTFEIQNNGAYNVWITFQSDEPTSEQGPFASDEANIIEAFILKPSSGIETFVNNDHESVWLWCVAPKEQETQSVVSLRVL